MAASNQDRGHMREPQITHLRALQTLELVEVPELRVGSGIVIIRYTPDTTAPTFTNATTFSFAENSATSSNAATISVNESSTIIITSGTDSARFSLVTSDSLTARIRFLSSPDFEAPADVGTNNIYDITVRATDTTGNSATQAISITVTNVNESTSIGAPTVSGTINKGISTSITVTLICFWKSWILCWRQKN